MGRIVTNIDGGSTDGIGMEVSSSKNPIIIDGKYISNPSWYASAEGSFDDDEFYNSDGDNYSYIDQKNSAEVKKFQDYLDAKKIGWVGATNPQRDNGKTLNRGRGYGTYGRSTSSAYFVYGGEWEALKNPPQGTPTTTIAPSVEVVTTNVPQVPVGQQPTFAQKQEQKKKGIFWDKAKGTWIKAKESGVLDWLAGIVGIKLPEGQQGSLPPAGSPQYGENTTDGKDRKLSKNAKIGITIGGLLVVGLIIYSISKKRK